MGRMDDGTRDPGPPPVPPPAAPAATRPTWTYALMPAAVLLGAAVIAGAVWFTRDDAGKATAAPPAGAVVSTVDVAGGSAPTNLLTAFTGYAEQTGLDETAFRACLGSAPDGAVVTAQRRRGEALGVTGTPTFFINNKRVVGTQPRAIFEEVINAELKGSPTTLEQYSPAIRQLAERDQFSILPQPVDVSDAVFDGSPQAKVVVAEFSDFQCPFCKRWGDENLGWLRAKLGDDVALAFLHMPLTEIHKNAGYASLAAVCADKQGKFWEMHDLLFARQSEWKDLNPN